MNGLSTFKRGRRRIMLSAAMAALTLAVLVPLIGASDASAASTPNTALINGESVTTIDGFEKGTTPISLEQFAAEQAGYTVTVVSGAEWDALTAAEFAKYQVLVVGDPFCNPTAASANSDAGIWAPVVMGTSGGNTLVGNRAVIGTDPEVHYGLHNGAEHLVQDGIAFAGFVKEATGVYYDTSCSESLPGADVATLDQLTTTGPGHWTSNTLPPCGGSVQLIAEVAQFETGATKLEDSDIQGWECSDHITFPAFPADWSALAVATDTTEKPTCGTDPRTKERVCGQAYVLVAGKGVVVESELVLTPKSATNPAGGEHTVTATVTEEKTKLVVGAVVTFVITGQNSGVTGTCTTTKGASDPTCATDETGGVRFTYKDTNGVGEDTINASVTVHGSTEHATATEKWEAGTPPPTTTTTSLSGEGKSGASITVKEGAAVTDTATLSGTNAATATGTVEYKVYSDNACIKEVASAGTVTVSGATVPASEAKTLKPAGIYYWQASYSGDANNGASKSECKSEVETVEGEPPPPPCTKVVGSAKVAIRKEGKTEQQKVENNLSTNLASKQKLIFKWNNGTSKLKLTKLTSASCVVETLRKKFTGQGKVTVNGEPGWIAKFYFIITNKQAFTFHIHVSKPKQEPFGLTDKAAALTSETIS